MTSGSVLSRMMMFNAVLGLGNCPIRTNTFAVSMILSLSIAENIHGQENMPKRQGARDSIDEKQDKGMVRQYRV